MAKDFEEYEDEEVYDEEEEEDEDEEELDEFDGLREEIKRVQRYLKNVDIASPEYHQASERLAVLTECKRNMESANNEQVQAEVAKKNRNAWLWQMLGNVAGASVTQFGLGLLNQQNVKRVTEFEKEGGIVNGYASKKFIKGS